MNVVDTVFTTDYVAHAENKEYKGQEFVKRFSKQLQNSILDVCVLRIEILVEEKYYIVATDIKEHIKKYDENPPLS